MLVFYMEAWLRGHGAVALIIWKMLLQKFQEHKFGNGCITVVIEDGRTFNDFVQRYFDDEVEKSSPNL
jgi:hypothetical protein